MKKSKKLLFLLVILAVIAVAAIILSKLNLETGFSTKEEEEIALITEDTESVTALSWTYDGTTLSFEKDGDEWVYSEDTAFPVDTDQIETALYTLCSLTSDKKIEKPDDLEQYGLDDPICTVTLTAENSYTLCFGNTTEMDGEYYLSMGDDNVYLVDSYTIEYFNNSLNEYVKKETIPSMTEIKDVTVKTANQTLELLYQEDSGITYSDAYVWFAKEGNTYQELDTDNTKSFISKVSNLTWTECINYNADESALAEYGLDAPTATITINYVKTTEVNTGEVDEYGNDIYEEQKEDAQFILEIGDTVNDICYARIAGSNMVYSISASVSEAMQYTTIESLLPDELVLVDWEKVTAIDITLDGESCRLDKSTEEEADEKDSETESSSLSSYLLNGESVDISSISNALDALITSGSANDKDRTDSPSLSFTFHCDSEAYPEVTLQFYDYNINFCLATLNDTMTYLVSRDEVTSLIDTVKEVIAD